MYGFDFNSPRYPVRTPDATFRWSVGYYRSPRKRVVLAWFLDPEPARDYCADLRRRYPFGVFDVLSSMF